MVPNKGTSRLDARRTFWWLQAAGFVDVIVVVDGGVMAETMAIAVPNTRNNVLCLVVSLHIE